MAQLQSVDGLLEQGVLALYRCWPRLPHRTTLPALDQLRATLAAELDALAPTPDQERFRRAAAGFAVAALRLPLVRSVAGDELDRLAALQPPANRTTPVRAVGLLSTAPVTAERLEALAGMLRAADPPAYAVQRWFYVANETPEAWNELRPALATLLDRLPNDARQQLSTIDATLATMLAGASHTAVTTAYEAALKQLETIPGVVAALTDQFFKWKEAQKLIRRSAAGFGAAGEAEATAAIPKGAAALPGADESTPEAAIAPTLTTIPVNFHTEVKFPVSVQRRQVNWLIVRLRLQKPEATAASSVVPVEFTQVGNDAPPPEHLTVRVLAPDFDEETRLWERTITVRYDQDSDPAVFLLKSDQLGKKRITIDFYHKGRQVGSVAFVTEVTEIQTSGASVALPRGDAETPEFARFERTPPPPADLHLRVVKKVEANTLAFWLDSALADVPYRSEFMGETPLTSKDPMTFLAQELDPLDAMVAALTADLTEAERADATQKLILLAEGLFEQLLPERFREEYFTRIAPLREAGVIRSLLITSDEPWIPWELLKPYHYSVREAKEYTDDFWATRFQLARWLAGRGPLARVDVKTAALVLPDVGLPAVDSERIFFDDLSARRMIALSGPSVLRQEVLDLFTAGGYQVMHIATHGRFNAEDADQSVIELADAPLHPGDLRGSLLRGIRRSMPLVFLNACDGGRANFGLTGLGGWAEKLFKEANAAAFVGALWEVHDELAVEFSKHFYNRLAEGDTLGEAMRAARAHLRELDPVNPTWLAYTLYGDPNAAVQIGSA
ncbi:MAG: CHAT domain-containing protein [Caldilineaceae bacterium]|nr:CHAT domain-containing protein [Caldilineaceae bacterium]